MGKTVEDKLKQIQREFDTFTRRLGELELQALMPHDKDIRTGQEAKDALRVIGRILAS